MPLTFEHPFIEVQPQTVRACYLGARMRGNCAARMVKCDDGRWYVVKFNTTPAQRRRLINEWIGTSLLRSAVATPDYRFVRAEEEFLARVDSAASTNTGPANLIAGLHFGSGYPGDPARVAVYDFLPAGLLIRNRLDFAASLVFDAWLGNTDFRQCIFVRTSDWREQSVGSTQASHPPLQNEFDALMIDNSHVFGGSRWDFGVGHRNGVYPFKHVYEGLGRECDFDPWIEHIRSIPDTVFAALVSGVPDEWSTGEAESMNGLVDELLDRRNRLRELLASGGLRN